MNAQNIRCRFCNFPLTPTTVRNGFCLNCWTQRVQPFISHYEYTGKEQELLAIAPKAIRQMGDVITTLQTQMPFKKKEEIEELARKKFEEKILPVLLKRPLSPLPQPCARIAVQRKMHTTFAVLREKYESPQMSSESPSNGDTVWTFDPTTLLSAAQKPLQKEHAYIRVLGMCRIITQDRQGRQDGLRLISYRRAFIQKYRGGELSENQLSRRFRLFHLDNVLAHIRSFRQKK